MNLTKVESGCGKTMGETMKMNITSLIEESKVVKCCHDNHIRSCIPGKDDHRCNQICSSHCSRGGQCKIVGHKAPRHFCHCKC